MCLRAGWPSNTPDGKMAKARRHETAMAVIGKIRDGFSVRDALANVEGSPTLNQFGEWMNQGDKCSLGFNLRKAYERAVSERPIAQLEMSLKELEDNKAEIKPLDVIKQRISIAKLQAECMGRSGDASNEADSVSIKDIENYNKKQRSKFGV